MRATGWIMALAFVNVAAALAPATGAQPAPEGPASTPAAVLADPLGRAFHDLAAEPAPSVAALDAAFLRLYQDLGYGAPPNETGQWYHYLYPVGDRTGDGVDDLVADSYCTDPDGCSTPLSTLDRSCGQKHELRLLDGRTGDAAWELTDGQLNPAMDLPWAPPLLGCVHDLVLGTVPGPHGDDLLLYRWEVLGLLGGVVVHHNVTRVDAATHTATWSYTGEGAWTGGGSTAAAHDLFLLPVLQVPPTSGLRLMPAGTKPGLVLRGLGFASAAAGVGNPVTEQTVVAVDWFQPIEHAVGLSLDTGHVLWDVDTLQPQKDRSVFPMSYEARRFAGGHAPVIDYAQFHWTYFGGVACCEDLTGDGVPDYVLLTLEWFPVVTPKVPGVLQGTAIRVYAWDGADGHPLYSLDAEPGSPLARFGSLTALGDVDGDGAADFDVTLEYFDVSIDGPVNYHTVHEVRSGRDGRTLWTEDVRGTSTLTPFGDADHDGGNDVLYTVTGRGDDPVAGLVAIGRVDVEARSGKTGAVLWKDGSVTSGIDVAVARSVQGGADLGDYDGDGVGDVVFDTPKELPDQTVVHALRIVSGATDRDLFVVYVAGSFAFLSALDDIDGDGHQDFAVVQGDAVDLWMTLYHGSNGTALWSRRLLTTATSSAALAAPLTRFFVGEYDGAPGRDVVASLTYFAATGGGFKSSTSSFQQIESLDGTAGRLRWALPEVSEGDASLQAHGYTPATRDWMRSVGLLAVPSADAAKEKGALFSERAPWPLMGAGGAALASLALAFVVAGRRLKK